jgi:hypothetical protein
LDWKPEEQRQDRLVQFAARNRVKLRILGIICLAIVVMMLLAIAVPRVVDRTGHHTKSDRAWLDIALRDKGLDLRSSRLIMEGTPVL